MSFTEYVYSFDHLIPHEVFNNSKSDRIHIIVDCRKE